MRSHKTIPFRTGAGTGRPQSTRPTPLGSDGSKTRHEPKSNIGRWRRAGAAEYVF